MMIAYQTSTVPVHEFPYIFGGHYLYSYFEGFDIDINGNIVLAEETYEYIGSNWIDIAPMMVISP